MKKPALIIAGFVFTVVLVTHWVRAFRGDEVIVAGYVVPVGWSLILSAIIFTLAVWMFVAAWESDRGSRGGKVPRDAGEQEDLAQREAPHSIISEGMHVDGDMKCEGHVHIDGTIKGDLQAATSVVVGKKGSIEGNVAADTINIHGFVSGNITARVVEIRATAHVVGDTMHDDLYVEKGACLDGDFRKRATTEQAQTKASK